MLPATVPTMLASQVIDRHFSDLPWVSAAFTIVELLAGLWIMGRGKRLAVVYLIVALILSVYGSLFINIGMRI